MVSERQDESKKERERGVSINLQKTFVTLLLIQNGKNTKELEYAVGSGYIMISLVLAGFKKAQSFQKSVSCVKLDKSNTGL